MQSSSSVCTKPFKMIQKKTNCQPRRRKFGPNKYGRSAWIWKFYMKIGMLSLPGRGGKWRGFGSGFPYPEKILGSPGILKSCLLKMQMFRSFGPELPPIIHHALGSSPSNLTFNFCFCLVIPTLSSQAASFPDSCRQFWPSDDLAWWTTRKNGGCQLGGAYPAMHAEDL